MHEHDDPMDDRWMAHLLGERPEPRQELRAEILGACYRERAGALDRRRRRYRSTWLALAACALVLSLVDIGANRHSSAQIAQLINQKTPPMASAVAAFRARSAALIALLREPDLTPGPAGVRKRIAPTLPTAR